MYIYTLYINTYMYVYISIYILWYTLRFSSKTNKWNLVITCDGLAVFVVVQIVVHKCYFISNILFALPFETNLTLYIFYAAIFCLLFWFILKIYNNDIQVFLSCCMLLILMEWGLNNFDLYHASLMLYVVCCVLYIYV